MTGGNGIGPLRHQLLAEMTSSAATMKDLTVLATQNDPYRIDTPAGHRDGAWLANTARDLGLGDREIHLRGLHYMMIGRPKPDGTPYTNTDPDWRWLAGHAGKAARWLGYIPFDQIVDKRNAEPVVREHRPADPWPYVDVGLDMDIPDAADIDPQVGVADFVGEQPYKLVLFGEKASLAPVLEPIASSYDADLYLVIGEISDTLLHQIAKTGAEDGRPMVVMCFCDADPAGWQMPISIARKLQAFQTLRFADLDFQVHRVGLTPDQVREFDLPSTPLKDTERRADRWREAMGVEQTEIDALASLRPRLLHGLTIDAIAPFYDLDLARRVREAKQQWVEEAQAAVDAAVDSADMDRLRAEAEEKLSQLREEIDAINEALRVSADRFDLPPVAVPTAHIDPAGNGTPLLDSGWSFSEQCRRLITSKAYIDNAPRRGEETPL